MRNTNEKVSILAQCTHFALNSELNTCSIHNDMSLFNTIDHNHLQQDNDDQIFLFSLEQNRIKGRENRKQRERERETERERERREERGEKQDSMITHPGTMMVKIFCTEKVTTIIIMMLMFL